MFLAWVPEFNVQVIWLYFWFLWCVHFYYIDNDNDEEDEGDEDDTILWTESQYFAPDLLTKQWFLGF